MELSIDYLAETDYSSRMKTPTIIPVILCGGAGKRLWPVSDEKTPKHLCRIIDDKSLLENTIDRVRTITDNTIICITTKEYHDQTQNLLHDQHVDIITEPVAKGTTAAIALATAQIKDDDTILWIMPCDHIIQNKEALQKPTEKAADFLLRRNGLITLGIPATNPSPLYGYIKAAKQLCDGIFSIDQFIEKPCPTVAKTLIDHGNVYWNSGMFIGKKKDFRDALIDHAPDTWHAVTQNDYNRLPDTESFDIAIMEKTDNAYVIPCDCAWKYIGTWDSIWDISDKDTRGNVVDGNVTLLDTENCLIKSSTLTVKSVGIKNLIIIEKDGQLFITDKDKSHLIKDIT